ncbi:MAG: antibiotic biosynthesis monooxygenase family protein [Paracoccaceae bacterium]
MANYLINGTITCAPEELDMFLEAVTEHISLTRAEPGNISFDIKQSIPGSCKFLVSEQFNDQVAFEVHTVRTRASPWWNKTKHIPRMLTYSGD